MGAKNLKTSEGTPIERTIRLISKLMNSHGPVSFDVFFSEEWGARNTVRRFLQTINETWELYRGIPLFDLVDEDGNPWVKGREKFIRLRDMGVRSSHIASLAMMPAMMQFMRILRGTHFEKDFQNLFKSSQTELTNKERAFLRSVDRRFYQVAKGTKNYVPYTHQISAVYEGLLNSRVLDVHVQSRKDRTETYSIRLRPLTLVNFNHGLYLLALNDKHPEQPSKKYRIETFEAVTCTKDTFEYPLGFYPEKYFADSFGIYGADGKQYAVRIALLDKEVEMYVRDRSWTNSDRYSVEDGVTILEFTVNDLVEVTSWILSFGPAVKVLGPKELRKDVVDRLRAGLGKYDST